MTKEKYVELMKRFQQLDNNILELDDAAYRLFDTHLSTLFCELEALICDAVTYGMNDEAEWTGYFAFERDFNLDEACVQDNAGNLIDTHSWEKIYDLIVDTNESLGVKF